MITPNPSEDIHYLFEILEALNLKEIAFITIAFAVFLLVFNMFFHDPNTVSGEQARQIEGGANNLFDGIPDELIYPPLKELSESQVMDLVNKASANQTIAPAQPFTACPKCGAPRTSHTCEYCKQTLF